ncbi:MAG: DUF6508 domain-containing protein [Ignavibacteria bacterium]|nr:DUF6508 domain-containing protein [Ignavibacteria bacterium]
MSDFSIHLKSLTKNDWQKLFSLQHEIENAEKFGKLRGFEKLPDGSNHFPLWTWEEITSRFFRIVHELGIIPVFDWTSWVEGKLIIENKNQDYTILDVETLCKLLTMIIRADRFNDGFLIVNLVNGTIIKIIKALQTKIQ